MSEYVTAIRKAYIDPICSVMLVDEEFPSYGDLVETAPETEETEERGERKKFKEPEIARELWSACHHRGWVCDIKNSNFEEAEDLKKADVVVLDYKLDGNSPDLAKALLTKLAEADKARLVILYTKENELDVVKRGVAACLRGAMDQSTMYTNLNSKIDDIDEKLEGIKLEPSGEDLEDWMRGKTREVIGRLKNKIPSELNSYTRDLITYFLEEKISELGTTSLSQIKMVDLSGASGSQWVFCRNLFVAIVGKKQHQSEAVFGELEQALQEWNPTPIHLCLAYARAEITRRGFEVERAVPQDPALEIGLTYFALTEGPKEGTLVLFDKIWEVLGRKIGDKIGEFGNSLIPTADGDRFSKAKELCGIADVENNKAIERLDAFLCSEQARQQYLRTGTILGSSGDEDVVWICVTPLCDLEPGRTRSESWDTRLDPFRSILFLRAPIATSAKAVRERDSEENGDENSHVLWIEDGSVRCASVATIRTETMLAVNDGSIQNSIVKLRRVAAKDGDLELQEESFRVLGQLRDQYAGMLLQRVGVHASRIGVDFIKLPKQ